MICATFFNNAGTELWGITADEACILKQKDPECIECRAMLNESKNHYFEFCCTVPVPKKSKYSDKLTVNVNVEKVNVVQDDESDEDSDCEDEDVGFDVQPKANAW